MRGMFVLFYHFYWFIRVDRAFPYIIKTFVGEFNLTLNIQKRRKKKPGERKERKRHLTHSFSQNTPLRHRYSANNEKNFTNSPRFWAPYSVYSLQESCFPRMLKKKKKEMKDREQKVNFRYVYRVKIESD